MIDFRKDFARVFIPAVCTECIDTDDGKIFQFRFFGGVLNVPVERLPEGYTPKKFEECILEACFVPDIRVVKLDSIVSVQSRQIDSKFSLTQSQYDSGAFGSVAGNCQYIGDGFIRLNNGAGDYPVECRASQSFLKKNIICSVQLKQGNVWNNKSSRTEKGLLLVAKKIENAVAEK